MLHRVRSTSVLILILLSTALSACSGPVQQPPPEVAAGQALLLFGHQFLELADAWDQAYRAGAVTEEQYRAWLLAGKALQQAWLGLHTAWQARAMSADEVLDRVQELRRELFRWAIEQVAR